MHGHVPALQASTVERWPKQGRDCCMDVPAVVPQEEYLLTNQRREGIRDVLYERQPLAECLALKSLPSSWRAALSQACFQSGSFIGHEKQQCLFFFHRALPLYAVAHMHCPHPSCVGSVARH